MAISGSVELLVNTEIMVQQAGEVERLAADMRNRFDNISDIILRTRNYWIGEAGDLHRQRYDAQKENIEQMLRRLMEHPNDLRQMAGIYVQGEQGNVAKSQQLPSDALG